MAVEPQLVLVSVKIQVDPVTFEAEATPASILHVRAARALKFCSISVSLAANPPNVFVTCDSVRDIQFVRAGVCASCASKCTNFERIASSFSSACTSRTVRGTKI